MNRDVTGDQGLLRLCLRTNLRIPSDIKSERGVNYLKSDASSVKFPTSYLCCGKSDAEKRMGMK